MAGCGEGSRLTTDAHCTYCRPLESQGRCSHCGFWSWVRWTVLVGCLSGVLLLLQLTARLSFWHQSVVAPALGATRRHPSSLTPRPRSRVLPPLPPLVTHKMELAGDREHVLILDPPSNFPQPPSGPWPLLAALAAVLSAAVSTNAVHLQNAVESLRSVFAAGDASLLHQGHHILSEQQELLVNLLAGFFACSVSVTLTYPMDTLKTRKQAKGYQPGRTGWTDLYKGLVPSLLTVCPSASLFVAASYGVKRFLLSMPGGTSPLVASLVSGAFCNAVLSLYRVPADMLIKLLQTDVCRTVPEALHRIFFSRGALRILIALWAIILVKAIPNGALKIAVYEFYDAFLTTRFAAWGMSKFTKSMVCGACSGMTTGLLTTPIDVVMTRIMTQVHDKTDPRRSPDGRPAHIDGVSLVRQTCAEIYSERGMAGFFTGALLRATYYAPSSCSFFAVFETLKVVFSRAMVRP